MLPQIRHLAWMLQAAQLHSGAVVFQPSQWCHTSAMDKLAAWEAEPLTGPSILRETPHYRLGIYFESLYECMMTELLGWTLLTRNLPVRENGSTLGELDFVLLNPGTGDIEHHEIAVKFYMAYPDSKAEHTPWYGPNPDDRLDLKTTHLLERQLQMSCLAQTHAALANMGIPPPHKRRIFLPGYLFYPLDTPVSAPESVALNHARGSWQYSSELRDDWINWVPLVKPHWLGPMVQTVPPDAAETHAALELVSSRQQVRLFAQLQQHPDTGFWTETRRCFVVPDSWPGQDSSSTTRKT
ncbi:DUF1853 family protein [Pseudohongiella spirulinae]|uniref:DUF1853 family protein n=1 Tax=Pseudohongiella spirulinae TaxID=1249552 RepID=UPI001F456920|nr:DUF1853 family protein [Pseudohongiella spirulinae]